MLGAAFEAVHIPIDVESSRYGGESTVIKISAVSILAIYGSAGTLPAGSQRSGVAGFLWSGDTVSSERRVARTCGSIAGRVGLASGEGAADGQLSVATCRTRATISSMVSRKEMTRWSAPVARSTLSRLLWSSSASAQNPTRIGAEGALRRRRRTR